MNTQASIALSLLFGAFVFFALQPNARAAETPTGLYVCAARVDCGSPGLPSTQDLPAEKTPTVRSNSASDARDKCMATHTRAYARLARSIDEISTRTILNESRGCKIVSEAFPTR